MGVQGTLGGRFLPPLFSPVLGTGQAPCLCLWLLAGLSGYPACLCDERGGIPITRPSPQDPLAIQAIHNVESFHGRISERVNPQDEAHL